MNPWANWTFKNTFPDLDSKRKAKTIDLLGPNLKWTLCNVILYNTFWIKKNVCIFYVCTVHYIRHTINLNLKTLVIFLLTGIHYKYVTSHKVKEQMDLLSNVEHKDLILPHFSFPQADSTTFHLLPYKIISQCWGLFADKILAFWKKHNGLITNIL